MSASSAGNSPHPPPAGLPSERQQNVVTTRYQVAELYVDEFRQSGRVTHRADPN